MRRARSEGQKLERRADILATALAMYEREPSFATFTMAELAERAGLAKGTLYLYFRTKEELFLALLEQLFDGWFAQVERDLEHGRGPWSTRRVAELLVAASVEHDTLARLLSILGTIVEQNVEFDAALRFKRGVLERSLATGGLLERRLPWMRPGQGARLLVHLHALVIGVWQLAEPSPVIRRVLGEPGMEGARMDFGADLHTLLLALLQGMEREAAGA